MSALRQSSWMTENEYLVFERENEIKHEYFSGNVYAMSGASEAHNLINVNLLTTLKNQLRGKGCKVYPADMRVKVEATRLYTYPDVSVVCDDAEFVDGEFDTLINPIVLIEILSPSTERYDRGKKFQDYRELSSLKEYVLVSQNSPRIEHFLRQADNTWQFTDVIGLDASLDLQSIKCRLALTDVYDLIEFKDQDTNE